MGQFVEGIEFFVEHCCECRMPFAITMDMQRARRDDHKWFYCPQGHPQHYTGPSEADKLRGEVEKQRQEVERQRQMREAEAARRLRVEQERDEVARAHNRMRTRVMNGVCPCCNRTFQNLMQHMKTEHAGEFNLRVLRTAFGMSQGALAKEIGVTAVYVSLHENGKHVPEYAKRAIETWIDRQSVKP